MTQWYIDSRARLIYDNVNIGARNPVLNIPALHGKRRTMSRDTNVQTASAFPKGMGKPALRALATMGIADVDQAAEFTERQLLALHGMGPKAIGILREALHAKGKSFAEPKQSG